MKARLYFAAVLFFMRSRVRKPHTDLTDLTEFARLMLNLTDALRTFAPLGSHGSHSRRNARLVVNLTDASRLLLKKKTPILSI